METNPNVVAPSNSASADAQQPSLPQQTKKPKLGRNRIYTLIAAGVIVIAGTCGYTFAYYLPNKPENVWKSALSNSSEGYAKLVDYANTVQTQKKFETSQIDGDFKVTSPSFSTDGTVSGTVDKDNAVINADLGLGVSRIKLNTIAKDVSNSESPDIYVKINGIKGLGQSILGDPRLDTLDGQWITVDHSLLDSALQQANQSASENKDAGTPKQEDVVAAAKVVGSQLDEYVFTTKQDKAVMQLDSFVGKETVEGKQTNHYKVKVNKAHLKSFVTSLGSSLDKTKLNDWFKQTSGGSFSKTLNDDQVMKTINDLKDGQTYDVWVNTGTKLVQQIKFVDSKNPDKQFVTLGLNYDGKDSLPFYLAFKDEMSDTPGSGRLDLNVDMKTNIVKLGFTTSIGTKDNNAKIVMHMTAKPADKKVQATAPSSSISLAEALSQSGLDSLLGAAMGSTDTTLQGDATSPYSLSL